MKQLRCGPACCYWPHYIKLWSMNVWWDGGVCTVIFVSNPTTVLRLCCGCVVLGLWQYRSIYCWNLLDIFSGYYNCNLWPDSFLSAKAEQFRPKACSSSCPGPDKQLSQVQKYSNNWFSVSQMFWSISPDINEGKF